MFIASTRFHHSFYIILDHPPVCFLVKKHETPASNNLLKYGES